jgi:putative photosynthetic complex assembly protein
MSAIDASPFPRGALIGAGLLIIASLSLVVGVRVGVLPGDQTMAKVHANAVARQSRTLVFADGAAGGVVVTDARSGVVVARIAPGDGGFIRGVMRGLAYHRSLKGAPAASPFELSVLSDGALVLFDPQTERRIDLGAFGATNRAAFAALLDAGASPRT